MSKEQQKNGGVPQRHDITRGHGMKSEVYEEQQLQLTLFSEESSTEQLMERIADPQNLKEACRKVKANKGTPGIDGMTTTALEEWLRKHEATLRAALLEGKYTPQPVKGVQIPKPDGGVRQLGIPTVVDRMIQQAILQILDPLFDPTFSEHSYGFRIGKNAHGALQQASEYVEEGRGVVVDIDLEKFFDRVNHDKLMGKVAKRIRDKRLLKLIRRYLQAGMMDEGIYTTRAEGTPQGGPLSPLLANLLLDDLDKELEKRGHCFCRYADDCNIYVRSEEAGKRVKESITRYLEKKLKLKVNPEKSCVARTTQRKFLGYRIYGKGKLAIAPQSIEKLKNKIREKTPRRIAQPLEEVVRRLNQHLTGWINYFQHTEGRTKLGELDGWIRRRLRAIKLHQLKRLRTIGKYLESHGASSAMSWKTATSGKGIWRLSKTPGVHRGMRDSWLEGLGLCSLKKRWEELTGNLKETAVYGTVRTVV
jgi:RNA-directed DNA polymerase